MTDPILEELKGLLAKANVPEPNQGVTEWRAWAKADRDAKYDLREAAANSVEAIIAALEEKQSHTCFECGHELEGPSCPACNAEPQSTIATEEELVRVIETNIFPDTYIQSKAERLARALIAAGAIRWRRS